MAEKQELRGIVRLAGADMEGGKQLFIALRKVKGIGPAMASAIIKAGSFEPREKIGLLPDADIKKIEDIMTNPKKYHIPYWMYNRKKNPETGDDQHLISAELTFANRQDIKNLIDMKWYRGTRHMYGLPAGGQRTRSSFRKGKSMGVVKKKSKPATKK